MGLWERQNHWQVKETGWKSVRLELLCLELIEQSIAEKNQYRLYVFSACCVASGLVMIWWTPQMTHLDRIHNILGFFLYRLPERGRICCNSYRGTDEVGINCSCEVLVDGFVITDCSIEQFGVSICSWLWETRLVGIFGICTCVLREKFDRFEDMAIALSRFLCFMLRSPFRILVNFLYG